MSHITLSNSSSSGSGGNIFVNDFAPNANLQEFDDFISTFGDNLHFSKHTWINPSSGSLVALPGTNTNPGIMQITAGGGGAGNGSMFLKQEDSGGSFTGAFATGGGSIYNSWTIQLSSLSDGVNTYRFSCGLADGVTINGDTDSFVDGIYFQYTNGVNSGQWTINCTKGSSTTTVNTTVAANTSFVTLSTLINAGGSSVSFFINNVQVATAISTNIPTNAITPFLFNFNLAGNAPDLNADLWFISNNLTTPRPGPSPVIGSFGILVENYRATAISTLITSTDAIIGVTSTASTRTITMPAIPAFSGQVWTVKDESGGAATNNITIDGNGKNIDNASTFVINTNFGSVQIYYSGTNYFII